MINLLRCRFSAGSSSIKSSIYLPDLMPDQINGRLFAVEKPDLSWLEGVLEIHVVDLEVIADG